MTMRQNSTADDPRSDLAGDRAALPGHGELADEVERARTPRTPLLALTGVWLTVAAVFAVVLAVVLLAIYLA
jgi:hypothetical protein